MENLTPVRIVEELDRYVIGQHDAKRAVAIALRNRWRRQQLPPEMADDVAPKNIIMIGPTGVGKTEIARRLAKLTKSPFIKVEASKFTEVGYVGRDVESMIRDLVELARNIVQEEQREINKAKAQELAEERLLDMLLPHPAGFGAMDERGQSKDPLGEESYQRTREKISLPVVRGQTRRSGSGSGSGGQRPRNSLNGRERPGANGHQHEGNHGKLHAPGLQEQAHEGAGSLCIPRPGGGGQTHRPRQPERRGD